MKVPVINRVAAYFMQIIAQTGGIIGVATLSFLYGRTGHFDIGWGLGIAMILSLAAAYAAGSLIGTIFLGIILHEPFRRIQGAPFKVGDRVIILRGRRKNKITEVYETWYPRMQVRVRLTDGEAKNASDAYSDYEIMKITESNQVPETESDRAKPSAEENQTKTTEPNQRLQTMRFTVPMNSIPQAPHV